MAMRPLDHSSWPTQPPTSDRPPGGAGVGAGVGVAVDCGAGVGVVAERGSLKISTQSPFSSLQAYHQSFATVGVCATIPDNTPDHFRTSADAPTLAGLPSIAIAPVDASRVTFRPLSSMMNCAGGISVPFGDAEGVGVGPFSLTIATSPCLNGTSPRAVQTN